jgi:uncharacterized membrane protein YkvA (DUF1232 family)
MWKLGVLWWKFKKEIMMVWAMLRNPAAPGVAKLVAVLAAVYIISPVDLVPDVIPILGWIDDGVVSILLFKLAFKKAEPAATSSKTKFDDVVDVKPKS